MRIRLEFAAVVLMASAVVFAQGAATQPLEIASFNVKWIGYFPERNDAALAKMLAPFDIVVIQELVSPPYPGTYPNGKKFKPDDQAREFFDAMTAEGFRFVLSDEDTGRSGRNHTNSAATEWFVAFYKPQRLCAAGDPGAGACDAGDLPNGFLAQDRTAHPDWERVPYAFGFRVAGGPDFVLISVHLMPDSTSAARARRKHELRAIAEWIEEQPGPEKDFIVLGDMNIYDCDELADATPAGLRSLNDECRDTATAPPLRPYDHVMYRPATTSLVDAGFDLKVIDLIAAMKAAWEGPGPYPGDPYRSKIFPKYYSDHHPVRFRLKMEGDDD